MLRLGVISELGTGENLGFARVSFDEVEMVSGWLPLPSISTKTAKNWQPIEVNSQVACLMDDECEQGCVAAVLWSETDTPPDWANENTIGIQFSDGAKIYYDSKNHKLEIEAPDAEVNMTCKTLNIKGEVNIDGQMSIKGDTKIDGDSTVTGTVRGDTDVRVGMPGMGVSLKTHMHPTAGSGTPSPPSPPS